MQEHSAFVPFEGAVKLQKGISMGDKMFYTAEDVLRSSSQVVIIGSDCPGIDESYLELALQELDKSINDVVLGPAMDGGYVLIAMKHPHHEIFQDIDWGSELVLQQTINRIQNCELGFSTLPALRDIDTAEDLESLL
jgi:rSAM/selenodomain-associated transferase 1